MTAKVAVVGAGVSGLSVALCLTDTLGSSAISVTVMADKFSTQGITSDKAGAVIYPHDGNYSGVTSPEYKEETRRWTSATLEWVRKLHVDHKDCGLEKKPGLKCYESERPLPWYKYLYPEFRVLSPEEIKTYNLPPRLKTVWKYDFFYVNTPKYMQYLTERFRENGGVLIQKKIHSLHELSDDYDVIINCTGLGARELVGDLSVYPVRGQMVEVEGPEVPAVSNKEAGNAYVAYIMPHSKRVFLGGTADQHNWSTACDAAQVADIYRKCVELCPQLEGRKVIGSWACLRPVREMVRLEVDKSFKSSLLIHNYGHGGAGFILSWGCAQDVTDIVRNNLHHRLTPSKL